MGQDDGGVLIRAALASDCEEVAELYSGYVRDSLATFELTAPSRADWQTKLADLNGLGLPFLVAVEGTRLVGYALVTPWRPRPGYRFTVEDSIYVEPGRTGQGLGRQLLGELVAQARAWGAKQMIAVVADSGEPASPALHLAAGFVEVGRLARVGFKHGRWVDTVLYQLNMAGPAG
ncbi:MAG TPA: GNAT family N-acetyltransferase [Candidatus Dormibacteraeota bacterium]|nr:GNAT family N-acetyltransferase [Candidatus Dormibacteraeota bacterium]